ncbi:MAG: glycerate kinase [Pseudomonadota bacterium]
MTPEEVLRSVFDCAVQAALPSKLVPQYLPKTDAPLVVIGAGKASAAMAAAVEANAHGPLSGLVITRYDHAVPCKHIEIVEAAHPVPDAAGAMAATRMLGLLEALGPDQHVLALISGGGSALLTLPPKGVSGAAAEDMNRALLASGASIDEMNCLRRHLSHTAGGRLAAAAHPAPVTTLMISDVPGDNPVHIASGPTVADPTTLEDARAVVAKYSLDLPPEITDALNDPAQESVKPGDPRLAGGRVHMIATPRAALTAAAARAGELGLDPILQGDALEGEARVLGAELAIKALAHQAQLAPHDRPAIMLSGGETTVTLPRDGRALGRGGRNVDFLLGLAGALNGAPGIWACAADTDGVDGLEEVAGAIVTPDTLARASRQLHHAALDRYDGHGFFETLGDQIITGPTLTNVNDFRAILIHPRPL